MLGDGKREGEGEGQRQGQEEAPPLSIGKTYAFAGKVIRLTEADFNQWQELYRETIPDLAAQLADDDRYYDRTLKGEERKQWFLRLGKKLNKQHQRVLSERVKHNGGAHLNESW